LVLRGAGERDVAGHLPDAPTLFVVGLWTVRDVLGDALAPDLLELLDDGEVDAVRVVDAAAGVAAGDDLGAQLLELLHGVDRDVARAADPACAPGQRLPAGRQHLLREVHAAVARCFLAHPRAAPVEPLARQHPGLVAVGYALVLAEEVADLALAHADVAGRHVGVLA